MAWSMFCCKGKGSLGIWRKTQIIYTGHLPKDQSVEHHMQLTLEQHGVNSCITLYIHILYIHSSSTSMDSTNHRWSTVVLQYYHGLWTVWYCSIFYWKMSVYEWTCAVHTHIVQESAVYGIMKNIRYCFSSDVARQNIVGDTST